MNRRTDFVVMTTDPRPGQSDHGHWTEHRSLADGVDCAERVKGRLYRRTVLTYPGTDDPIGDGYSRETLRRIFLASPRG